MRSCIEIFPRLGEIYFGELLGGKILREANIQNGLLKLEEKWFSFVVFEHIRARFMFSLMVVRQLLDTQSQQKTFMSSLLTSRQIIVV